MDHSVEVALIRRILDHVTAGTKDMAPTTTPGPVTEYFDADRHRREVDTLFRDYPLVVGHVSQVAAPGDFFTHDNTGVPILVVRDHDNRVKAFMNVCRHRS